MSGVLLLGATAVASPIDDLDPARPRAAEPLRVLVAAPPGRACPVRTQLCAFAGARSTVAVDPSAGPQRFARATSVASSTGARESTQKSAEPWTIDVLVNLKRAALAGNTLFLFYDRGDAGALAGHQYIALYQAPVAAGKSVAAHLQLDPEEGFRPGRTYRLQIAQLVNGREIVLAEGDLSLQ
jgi:hypothetical protein